MENAHVILHLQHCLEEKTQNFTRARQSSMRQVDVLCEARRCSSSYKCSAGNTYAELQTRTKQVWEADYVIRTQLFRCEKNHQKKENCLVENAHQEEESFFSFSVLLISSSSAADQLSSFRVACAVDRILSRNKLKILLKQTSWSAIRHVIHMQPVRSLRGEGWSS